MKNQLLKLLFVFIVTLAFFSSAAAWDDTGHKIITYIAWQQMSPHAREQAIKLLLSAPEDSDLSVFYLQDSRSVAAKQRELFMIAGTWADIVRDKKFKDRYAKYHHGTWHYLDTFWRDNNGKVELVTDLKSDDENVVERLDAFDKVLRDNSASAPDKAIALAWILHLVGDIHQPLHDSGRVTELEPKGDQGGNLFLLSPKDSVGENRLNLHWYWDSIIGRNIPRVNDVCDSDYIPAIGQEIMKNYPYANLQNRLEPGQFAKWQQEGFQIASTKLYPSTLIRYEAPSAVYQKEAFQIAQEQIALAGYRLGQMLNQIFDKSELTRTTFEIDKLKYRQKAKDSGAEVGQNDQDLWLWTKSRAVLAANDDLKDSSISVAVENGVITLSGAVADQSRKDQAINLVKEIEGIKLVKDLLKISPNNPK